jgi:hypothetical protein
VHQKIVEILIVEFKVGMSRILINCHLLLRHVCSGNKENAGKGSKTSEGDCWLKRELTNYSQEVTQAK